MTNRQADVAALRAAGQVAFEARDIPRSDCPAITYRTDEIDARGDHFDTLRAAAYDAALNGEQGKTIPFALEGYRFTVRWNTRRHEMDVRLIERP